MADPVRAAYQVLLDGPLPIAGVCDIIADYAKKIQGTLMKKLKSGMTLKLLALPDGKLASGSENGNVTLWDAKSGTKLQTRVGHTKRYTAMVILPGNKFASASRDCTICVWGVNSAEKLLTLVGHSELVSRLCAVPNGTLASSSWDDTVKVWDINNGECLRTFPLPAFTYNLISLPDCTLVCDLLTTASGWVRIGDAGKEPLTTDTMVGAPGSLIPFPDGLLVNKTANNNLRVWCTRQDVCVHTLVGHQRNIICMTALFGGRLASGSSDKTIRVWDVRRGHCMHILKGHSGAVTIVLGLQDGSLASASEDSRVRVWDVDTGQCLHTLAGHKKFVLYLVQLPDGKLASCSNDQTICVWD